MEYSILVLTQGYMTYLLILKREEGRERERNINVRMKHRLVAFGTCPDQGLNPQPRYVPRLVIEPAIFSVYVRGDAPSEPGLECYFFEMVCIF